MSRFSLLLALASFAAPVFAAGTKRIFCADPGRMSVAAATKEGVQFLGNVAGADIVKNVAIDPATHQVWTTCTDGTDSFAKS